ncbi:MAG: radical SAM protein, partial [Candidatus Berkelbacteria bacterium]|nr:radical SAM protein [Candidatus Berkelbacteria bacterium]
MEKFPEIITFRITSKCIFNCSYCYGPKKIRDLNFNSLNKIFRLFARNDVKSIVITGGEPMLRQDFGQIICQLKKYRFKIFLDTNGIFFFKYKSLINKKVAVLGLPLDFPGTKRSFRNEEQAENVIKILKYYQKIKNKPKIKIGTVVTKKNINYLNELASKLLKYKIDTWKIYQFIPIGKNASRNRKKLEISTKLFLEVSNKIKKKYSQFFNIVISKRDDRARAYFMLDPDGKVIMPIDYGKYCQNLNVGSIFNKNIIKYWRNKVSEVNYLGNFESTFRIKTGRLPIEEIYNKIWHKAKDYYKKGQFYTEGHAEWINREAIELAKKENFDPSIFLPFVFLHDIGYIKSAHRNPFNKESRLTHMLYGAKYARDILKKMKYPKEKIKEIITYISVHDDWALENHSPYCHNIFLGAFNDLDFISMFAPQDFEAMKKILNKSDKQMIKF